MFNNHSGIVHYDASQHAREARRAQDSGRKRGVFCALIVYYVALRDKNHFLGPSRDFSGMLISGIFAQVIFSY
jgi:hypothetical protein